MAETYDDVIKIDDEFGRFVPPFGGLTIAVERCPLCSITRKPFTCQKCIERGNFTHSNSRNPERYFFLFSLDFCFHLFFSELFSNLKLRHVSCL